MPFSTLVRATCPAHLRFHTRFFKNINLIFLSNNVIIVLNAYLTTLNKLQKSCSLDDSSVYVSMRCGNFHQFPLDAHVLLRSHEYG
jgi:hypothetical protein